MIKSMLVPATGADTDLTSLTTALQIARNFSGHIVALHVRLDAVDVALNTARRGGPIVEYLMEQLTREAKERETRAREVFENFCRRKNVPQLDAPRNAPLASVSAQWRVETGDEAYTIAFHGMLADLIIAPRSTNQQFTTRLILESALLNSGRPVLPRMRPARL